METNKTDGYITFFVILFACLGFLYFINKPVFNDDTYWFNISGGGSCEIVASRQGVELSIWVSGHPIGFTGFVVKKPSFINDLIHSEIRWRNGINHNCSENYQASSINWNTDDYDKTQVYNEKLSMFRDSDGAQSCIDKKHVKKIVHNFVVSKNIRIMGQTSTSSGTSNDELGNWSAYSDEDIRTVEEFHSCLKKHFNY
jgi:hypothetical protein